MKEMQWDSGTVVHTWMGVVLGGLLNRCDESTESFLLYLYTYILNILFTLAIK